jgi:Tfp pilus assembly protein PilF
MNLRWHISHARGYLELGMLKEAEAELAAIAPEEAARKEVAALRIGLLHEKRDWRALRRLAGGLVRTQPEEPGWWVSYAFATRRVASIEKARAILLKAEVRFPREAMVQFNLGCYACQLGDLEEAWRRVQRAIELDGAMRGLAREDPDLEPLRATGATFADGAV